MVRPEKTVAETLVELAEEHLHSMAKVPWAAYARSIRERAAEGRPAGDTYGCVIDGRYYDVGDSESWLDQEGGDIRLVSFATTYGADHEIEAEESRETIIRR